MVVDRKRQAPTIIMGVVCFWGLRVGDVESCPLVQCVTIMTSFRGESMICPSVASEDRLLMTKAIETEDYRTIPYHTYQP